MKAAKSKAAPAEVVAPVAHEGNGLVAAVQQTCSICKNWRPLGMDPVLGHCLRSSKALPAPMVTTDTTSCSQWSPMS